MFLKSLLLFWPLKQSNSSLTIIFDEEKRSYNGFAALYKNLNESIRPKINGGLDIYFNEPYSVHLGGHDRQQLLMFWADNFTDAEYVGFVDTDCVFITYIDREDLFERGKPVINGRIGVDTAYSTKHYDFWMKVPQATSKLIGEYVLTKLLTATIHDTLTVLYYRGRLSRADAMRELLSCYHPHGTSARDAGVLFRKVLQKLRHGVLRPHHGNVWQVLLAVQHHVRLPVLLP